MVDDTDMFAQYGLMNDSARMLVERYLPGALTLVVKKNKKCPQYFNTGSNTIGIRIPDHSFCLTLVRLLGTPIITTSANLAGEESPYALEQIVASFQHREDRPDIIFDAGTLPAVPPSTVVDVSSRTIRILRQGTVKIRSDVIKN